MSKIVNCHNIKNVILCLEHELLIPWWQIWLDSGWTKFAPFAVVCLLVECEDLQVALRFPLGALYCVLGSMNGMLMSKIFCQVNKNYSAIKWLRSSRPRMSLIFVFGIIARFIGNIDTSTRCLETHHSRRL